MRVWIDLSNSPHVNLFGPLVDVLEGDGCEVLLTVRDHAQTLDLARRRWPEVVAIGGQSPGGRIGKATTVGSRALALRGFAKQTRPDVALSHGSYAQVVAARLTGIPAVTMMDYEHQPANHLSFRLAKVVVVPRFFPDAALRRFGASKAKVMRYDGFKEELYLAEFRPDPAVILALGLDPDAIVAVMRPPPEGALYHRVSNSRFDDLLEQARQREDVGVVLLPRMAAQVDRYRGLAGVVVPTTAVDGCSLLASADLTIGAGGTMNRESALLGTPTYTVFAGRIAAADQELIRAGLMQDVRSSDAVPVFAKKRQRHDSLELRRDQILETVRGAVRRAVSGAST